jgi:SAM-dependent methyltransferase
MAEDRVHEAMRAYYQRAEEAARLDEPKGELEFERTKEIVLRHLPPPPATVADIGGGPGRYALWLAGLGYQVVHRDLMPLHVQQLTDAAAGDPRITSQVADARALDLVTASADAVLLLGPLYHLPRRADRVQALAEAARVVRPGGPVFAAVISRWAARIDGILRARLYQVYSQAEPVVESSERTGQLAPLHPGSFTCYTHRPRQLGAEVSASGLRLAELVCVEGPAYLLDDLGPRLADPRDREVVMQTARALERVPELIGLGPHLLATAYRKR